MNGEVFRLFSISEGEMFFPPEVMIMCLIRSTILTWVPSTHSPTSPVRSHPSSVKASAVCSGLFQYPRNTPGCLVWISPVSGSIRNPIPG